MFLFLIISFIYTLTSFFILILVIDFVFICNVSVRPPVQPMPRPVLPRERTLVDRLVDYLVGDGPSNRYALICRQCQSHNGMALREEFDFIGNK